ncbi:hypothetical protein [Burkholderia sp. SRS-W-2-2016]|uniref:hypothetical protein n=1 Tax=Burkholderia sp. SRS-W-2-2016 TaxID=1926878 RepID=UPI00117F78F8|nr:hypothetical protein [Burkholderia sp. SRS-W-2-2016]
MPIMSRFIKSLIVAGIFFIACESVIAEVSVSSSVELSGRRAMTANVHGDLCVIDVAALPAATDEPACAQEIAGFAVRFKAIPEL